MSTIPTLIINKPYQVPTHYWQYDREKRIFDKLEGRRPAGFLIATEGSKTYDDPGIFCEIPLVNKIRKRVDLWRARNYPGITGITRKLLDHWHNNEIRENKKFFFCQMESIETIIWLTESPDSERQGIDIPSDGGDFLRKCCKMATGSGKTTVIGMLIGWQVLNKITYPKDNRFTKNILIISPGLTVKRRLEVLRPSDKNSVYDEFNIIPSSFYDKLRQVNLQIHNWHALMPLQGKKKSVIKKGTESNIAFSRRILGDMSKSKNILVINDEGHHAWRKIDDQTKIDKEELETATRWIEGLDRIHVTNNIITCYDFSATPFIPGENVTEKNLFGWIVSDFSLNDAIESGLVKTPTIAVRDDGKLSADYKSRFYHIYKDPDVKANLNKKAKPEVPLPDLVKNAYIVLAQDWVVTKKAWEENNSPTPPVMISVCNRTETAARVEYSLVNNKLDFDEPISPEKLIRIDSKILNEAESRLDVNDDTSQNNSLSDKSEHLRETVNTIGKIGKSGEQIQKIVAVQMLSEGWDAKTVTHIMGLRAFTSQLLCEQVVGRGLRRTSYEINSDGLFDPEYVKIFGVPFTFLPFERSASSPAPSPAPTTLIQPVSEKKEYEIAWPNILRINTTLRPTLNLDLDKVKILNLDPEETTTVVDMAEVIDGKPNFATMTDIDLEKLNKKIRMQHIVFQVAKEVFETTKLDWKGNKEYLLIQIVKIVQEFLKSDKINILNVHQNEELRRKLVMTFNMSKIIQHIFEAIKFENIKSRTLEFDPDKPIKSTEDMRPWHTKKPNDYSKKSHINYAVHDSRWEAYAVFELERNSSVVSWVKNDHVGFGIDYIYNGILHTYYPDFLICLKNGITLVLEIKGIDSDQNRTKRSFLKEWVDAVTENVRFGVWISDVAFAQSEVKGIIKQHSELEQAKDVTTKCPKCDKIATTREGVEKLFGFRNINGFIRPQSWCRHCRKN
ncbi:MAG: DEAD/DEAH box helicase family protein [Nitrosopumilus sp.]|nr:DEAD/DEAH box helicase family protein [Nitrosopumilus sp.]MDH3779629.1 DEAD/DEAH box helicase family protein [Nitrosopumilus sp.]MDH3854815.1 DEAD/DEAH box helicase family protein [Nitrosopumilus sp.]